MTCSLFERHVSELQPGDLLLETGRIVTGLARHRDDYVIAWWHEGLAGTSKLPADAVLRVARPRQVAA